MANNRILKALGSLKLAVFLLTTLAKQLAVIGGVAVTGGRGVVAALLRSAGRLSVARFGAS